ncbi:hypothetical protein [Lacrimispora amygdalina]|uniref:hypothetical protein n=1 Tax=Lacrimispora amygdalina TaxID=253257 RepID=UPI000BE30D6F|nr:hypothetical protein [Lacrimispora amygdalina]
MKKIITSPKLKMGLDLLISINLVVIYYILLFVGTGNTLIDDVCTITAILLVILQIVRSFVRFSITEKQNEQSN